MYEFGHYVSLLSSPAMNICHPGRIQTANKPGKAHSHAHRHTHTHTLSIFLFITPPTVQPHSQIWPGCVTGSVFIIVRPHTHLHPKPAQQSQEVLICGLFICCCVSDSSPPPLGDSTFLVYINSD